jgi:hypothetical protein
MRIQENVRSRSLQRRRKMVTVGSHPNFPKEPGPLDQTEDAKEIYHREKPRRNPDIIRTIYLEGRVATIERHREKLDRRTGLSRQIRSIDTRPAVRSAKEANKKPSEFQGSGVHRAKNNDNENPEITRAKLRNNQDRQIKDEIWTVYHYGPCGSQETPSTSFGVRDFITQKKKKEQCQ